MPSCHETCCDKRRVPQRRKRSPSSYTIHRNVRVMVVPPPLAKSPGLFCVDGWSPSQKRALLSTYSSRNRKPSAPNSPWIRRPRRRRPAAKTKRFIRARPHQPQARGGMHVRRNLPPGTTEKCRKPSAWGEHLGSSGRTRPCSWTENLQKAS